MNIVGILFSTIVVYFIGAIPVSFLVARVFAKVDIRQHGSGNVGATNVYRVAGKLPGIFALIGDIAKGIVAVTVIPAFVYPWLDGVGYEQFRILLGFSAICGHIWTPFLQFKGGKGIATTIGVIGILYPKLLLYYLGIWFIVFVISQYVSLASVIASVSLPILAVLSNTALYVVLFTVALCVISTYRHKENIKRLILGTESKTLIGSK